MVKELAACGLQFCDDLAEEGTPWEVAAEPEPQYFATLTEAIQFRDKLFADESRERAEKALRELLPFVERHRVNMQPCAKCDHESCELVRRALASPQFT